MSSWNKGLSFTSLKKILNKELDLTIQLFLKSKNKKRISRKLIYLTIGYIELFNGCKINEAIEGFKEYMKTNKEIVYIKKEKSKKNHRMLIIIPNKVIALRSLLEQALKYGFDNDLNKITKISVVVFWIRKGINTYTFKYAFEEYFSNHLKEMKKNQENNKIN